MPPTVVTYIPYSEVSQRPSLTIEEFRRELGKFRLFGVIYLCSVVNSVLNGWEGSRDEVSHERLVRDAFPVEIANPLLQMCSNPSRPRGVFHRQQLLFVSKQALAVCPDTGIDPSVTQHWGGLGVLLLMANDLLPKSLTQPTDVREQMMNVMSDLIPVTEASGSTNPVNKIIRSYLMLNRFWKDQGDIQLAPTFEAATGMSVARYQTLTAAAFMKYVATNLEMYRSNPGDYPLSDGWFGATKLSGEQISWFFSEIAGTRDEYRQSMQARDCGANDFTCLREKPFFREGNLLIPIDLAFCAEKFETGPFWLVNRKLTASNRVQLHALWGKAFESYINWLLSGSSAAPFNHLNANPKFSNGDEVCDAIILSDDCAVFIESKGSTFTAAGKYGNDPDLLRSEVEDKLVGNLGGERKGVQQLAFAIEQSLSKRGSRPVQRPGYVEYYKGNSRHHNSG